MAEILGYSDVKHAILDHVDEEDRVNSKTQGQNAPEFGQRGSWLINESGLYSLILGSKLPTAKKFKHWVTSDVLPAIRKHGVYATDELLNDPDLAIAAFTALKEERKKNKALSAKIEEDKPKVLFADSVTASQTSILVGELAKLIKQNGIEIGQQRMFTWLRNNGFLIKRKGSDYNMPTQYSMELGLFEIKETSITHADGHVSVNKTPKITGKGQQFFINKFLGKKREVIASARTPYNEFESNVGTS